jgi:coproporphyrinogen III oxidase-like Fe-S oxidoreductase
MLGLRTIWGIKIPELEQEFSPVIVEHFHKELKKLNAKNQIIISNHTVTINPDFLFLTDGIIAQFFFVD